ncbi:hypothetical protein BCR37DRAFT_386247 [Protomyces lactucae-debilis]|uniref:Uncharacterized protein n=1 Tax=Protomyces lactucae-debilis TaxID=2754530 RepID=A0A1Y2FQA5_PROLT|nr:uncharacterized protein BCR37DRAFT_386247 [Protomyces lactucae-debilis]ORY84885.1 hypothetical protein BCR37DRAFT_386247 [Protomyces lactucae-debilis]
MITLFATVCLYIQIPHLESWSQTYSELQHAQNPDPSFRPSRLNQGLVARVVVVQSPLNHAAILLVVVWLITTFEIRGKFLAPILPTQLDAFRPLLVTRQCLHDHLSDMVRMKTVDTESFFRCPFCRTERKGQVSCRMHLKRICYRFAPYGTWLDAYKDLLNVSEPERSILAKKAQQDTTAAHDLRRQIDNHASQAPDPTEAAESSAIHAADQKRRLSMSSRITRSMHRDLPGCVFCFGHFETLEQYREHLCLAESGHYRDKSWCLQFVSTYENQDVAVRELKLAYQCLDKYPQKKPACKVKAVEACRDGDGDTEDMEATKMEAGTGECSLARNNRPTAVFVPLRLQATSTVLSGASSLISKKSNSAVGEDSASIKKSARVESLL